jgi:hypothetical protein
MTHTYALLQISATAYEEIAQRLRAAGYAHAFGDEGELDMHGIALVRGEPVAPRVCRWERVDDSAPGSEYEVGCNGQAWHLDPDLELYEFCPFCGGRILVEEP